MTILRALAWSQPTQGNTCSRLAGYDRCHWLAKLPPGLHTLGLRRLYSLSLSLLAKLAGFESSISSDFFDRSCFAFDSILPLPFFIFETERILWKIKINDILELDILYKIVIEINLYPVCLSIPFESKNV